MTLRARGLALTSLQLLLALAIFGRFQYDRIVAPRVWARTVPIDPTDVFRGRYLRLWLEAADRRSAGTARVVFGVDGERLVVRDADGAIGVGLREFGSARAGWVIPDRPVAYFLPEDAPDPTQLSPGQELWVELTVPATGLPRPIRLEVRPASSPRAP